MRGCPHCTAIAPPAEALQQQHPSHVSTCLSLRGVGVGYPFSSGRLSVHDWLSRRRVSKQDDLYYCCLDLFKFCFNSNILNTV